MKLPGWPIIDSHHHLGRRWGRDGPEFTGDDLVRRMEHNAISHTLVIHFVSRLWAPDDFRRANSYIAEEVARHNGFLTGGVVVGPAMGDGMLDEIATYHKLGFRAVKLHPIFHGHYQVNSGVVDEVAMLAGTLGLPVVIHSDFLSPVCSPYQIVALAKRFPETTFVLLHLGLQPELCRLVPDVVRDANNVMLDTSQTPDFPRDVYVEPVRRLGATRLVFGSDGPECDAGVNLRKLEVAIELYGLDPTEAQCILSQNATRVFGIRTTT